MLPAVGLVVGRVEVDRDEPCLVPQASPVMLDHLLEQSLAQSKEVLWPHGVLEAGESRSWEARAGSSVG
ncbi:MAG: hypothetical protein IPK72_02365 [Candidatus Eisenbacteria bacterium]|nr:hypothetical protein [Candidatus Eisenbacteria bacterium]